MGHANKKSLVKQIQDAYDERLAIGQSKHAAKKAGTAQEHIYSWDTYRSYMKQANYFAKYCKAEHGCKTLEQCRPYVDEYLQSRSHLSAYTQKLDAAALAKLYGCKSTDFVKTEARIRSNITRSRGEHGAKVRDRHFSEANHKDLVDFCRSTGLRRAELEALRGDKLIEKDGKWFIRVDSGSKGGRYREAPVTGQIEHVKSLMERAGSGKVFEKVPHAADIHSYRADYAKAIYNEHARPIEQIPYDRVNAGSGRRYQSEVYCCRGDQKGVKFDKVAMQIASEALGHNRISVVGEHYLY